MYLLPNTENYLSRHTVCNIIMYLIKRNYVHNIENYLCNIHNFCLQST